MLATPSLLRTFVNLAGPSQLRAEADFATEIERVHAYLRNLIATRNAAFSLISKLPNECMLKAFNFTIMQPAPCALRNRGSDEPPQFILNPRLLIPLLLVCRKWYDAAMNEPALWAGIDSMPWNPHGARTLLERSKNSPLAVSFSESQIRQHHGRARGSRGCYMFSLPIESIWNSRDLQVILQQSYRRIESLNLSLETPIVDIFTDSTGWTWSSLRSATISSTGVHRSAPHLPIIKADNLNSLTVADLRLSAYGDLEKHHFPNLRSFTWSVPPSETWFIDEIVKFLSKTPSLEELDCQVQWSQTEGEYSVVNARLPNLKKLMCQGTHSSPAFRLPRFIDYPDNCSVSYSFNPYTPLMHGQPSSLPVIKRDLAKILAEIIPSHLQLARRTRLILRSEDWLFPGLGDVIFEADAENISNTMPSVGALHFNAHRPRTGIIPPDAAKARDSDKELVNRDAEAMLTQICNLASLLKLTCSLEMSPDVWTRCFAGCTNLTKISLSGLPVAFQFAESLLRNAAEALYLPSLVFLVLQPQPRRCHFPESDSTATAYDITWSIVLSKFAEAFSFRMERTNMLFPRLAIRRGFGGCFVNQDFLGEAKAWIHLAAVVAELRSDEA